MTPENYTPSPETQTKKASQEKQGLSEAFQCLSSDLSKINDILNWFGVPEQEDNYRKWLLKQAPSFLEQFFNTSEGQKHKFLIQAQINELEAKGLSNFSRQERIQYSQLTDDLIALENQKQAQQQEVIANEKSETRENDRVIASENQKQAQQQEVIANENQKQAQQQEVIANENQKQANIREERKENKKTINEIEEQNEKLDKQNAELKALRGILLSNESLRKNTNVEKIVGWLDEVGRPETQRERREALVKQIIEHFKKKWTLESIAESLGWTDTQEYKALKTQLLNIEPSLQESFDRVEMQFLSHLAQIKLWNSNLDWVKLSEDILTKRDENFLIEVGRDSRNLSLAESNYTLASPLNPHYEKHIHSLHQQASQALKPIHAQQWELWQILKLLQTPNSKITLEQIKDQIQARYPNIYWELGISSQTSLEAIKISINIKQTKLQEQQANIYTRTKKKMQEIIAENTMEAKEKDKHKKHMLQFLNDIGFDILSQEKTSTIINAINRNPQKYGLQNKIDFENGELGYNHDFWNKDLATTEKQWFIQFFNKMLWEPIIDQNIAKKTTSLSPEAIMRLQVLNNRTVGYFLGNLEGEDKYQ